MEEDHSVRDLEGQTWVWQTMLAFADSMVLRCAVELGIADIIHEHGEPLSLPHLASLLPSPPPNPNVSFLRVMRFLTHKKIFSTHSHPETGETLYGLTPARVLVRSPDFSPGPMVLFGTHPFPIAAWHSFSASVRQGGTPYMMAHGMDTLSGTAARNPEFNAVFKNAMACPFRGILDAGISAYKDGFAGLGSLVDVGGGTGATLGEIVRLHPGIKGINFDLPHVIERAPEYPGVTHVAGDMFETIPPADAVFMKTVMHCFGDEECEKVLRNCRSVIPEKTGKVIIMDVVLYPDDNSPLGDIRAKFDMLMFAYTSTGRERTEEEWTKLLKASGFPRWNIIRIPAIRSIIEAFPE